MTGFDNHKVVTSKDLAFWLFNEASDHGVSIWKQQRTTLRATQYTGPVVPDFIFDAKTLTKADIMNEVWATYSTDENTTGIYITGYSVGDGKSGYANNQNVIAADIAYREAATPSDRVFKVFLEGDPDETNKGYFNSNTIGETVTFVVRTNVPIENAPIVISGVSATHTTPTSATFDSESDYYYYTFDVEITSVNANSGVISDTFTVTQGSATGEVIVYIPGQVESTRGILYTEMPYVFKIGSSSQTHDLTNDGYESTNFYNYGFSANLGSGSGTQTVTFPQTSIPGSRVSTRSNIPGMQDISIIRQGFRINQPAVFQLNVGRRTFTPRAAHENIQIQPDSTVLFKMTMNVNGSTSYSSPYTDYFQLSGTDIMLDNTFGTDGVTLSSGSLKAKLADSGDTGTISIKGNEVVGNLGLNEWWQYDQYSSSPDVYNIDKLNLSNVSLNNEGNFRIVAYKQGLSELKVMIAGNGTGNTYPTGWNVFTADFGDTISGTIITPGLLGENDDEEATTFNIVRPKFGSYILSSVYVIIPNYNMANRYVINMPTEQRTLDQSQTLCSLAYEFGSGVKCLDPDSVTTQLWKPSTLTSPIPTYGNLSEIRLCDVYLRDGNVPRCEKSYIKFRMVDNTQELIRYEAYVDDIEDILQEISPSVTLLIRIYSIYDSHAKEHGDFEPPVNVPAGFYEVSNKSFILASVSYNGDKPVISFCTTDGYYSEAAAHSGNTTLTQSDVAQETYSTASQYFSGIDRIRFTIGVGINDFTSYEFGGFIEMQDGASVNVIGSLQSVTL